MFETIEWTNDGVVILDQRRLPAEEIYLTCASAEDVAEAIRSMAIRGAPAIGVAAAMGLALGARRLADESAPAMRTRSPGTSGTAPLLPDRMPAHIPPPDLPGTASTPFGQSGPPVGLPDRTRTVPARGTLDTPAFLSLFEALCALFGATRPTAVNLFWAIDRMRTVAEAAGEAGADARRIAGRLVEEAARIKAEDLEACRAIGRHGQDLVPDGATILTHCNAGGLATAGYGTALGVVRAAKEAGKRIRVFADETRPFLQGARLTAWELLRDNIETTVITDGMAGHFLHKGEITLVVVGADRIAANGDVANKIGTYQVAVLAKENGVPFYVAAPISTIDLSVPDGGRIPIEERAPEEVTRIAGATLTPAGVQARNPAFDITPCRYITAIITERGVARPPYSESLRTLLHPDSSDR